MNNPDDFEKSVRTVPFDVEYFLIDGGQRIKIGDLFNVPGVLWSADREREYIGNARIPVDLEAGTYEIVIEIDTDDEVTESNENDNARSFTVEVEASDLPNLVVKSIESPTSVRAGTLLIFDFVVAELNDPDDFQQSVRSVPFDMKYFLVDDGERIEAGQLANPTGVLWPANREREYIGNARIPDGLSPGTYEIIVEVDANNEVAESNENDNERSFTVEVTGGSTGTDLELVSFSIIGDQTTYAPDELVRTTLLLCWSDKVGRDANFQVWESLDETLDDDDRSIGSFVVLANAFDGQGCDPSSFQASSTAFRDDLGPRYWILRASSPEDTNTSNNERSISFTVGDNGNSPLLRVDSELGFVDTEVGRTSASSLQIFNDGTAPLIVDLTILDGEEVFEVSGATSATIQAGELDALFVQFTPLSATRWTGSAALTHNAPNVASPVIINLEGSGISTADAVLVSLPEVSGSVAEPVRIPITLAQLDNRDVLACWLLDSTSQFSERVPDFCTFWNSR
ncbi:MAG: CARDB domain-containing protein, partial [Bacteroidota bacterium]